MPLSIYIKMKVLVLSLFVVAAFCKNLPNENAEIVNWITQHGYPAEAFDITTEDGYMLQMFRIPHGRQQNQNQPKNRVQGRPAVFLMHGFMSTAEDFVYGGPSQGLAYQLADEGFDVYMGNARGSRYGQRHTTLDPSKDTAFWRFCFDDIGMKDLPAFIDKIISKSQQQKIYYIGHMEGATAFYVMASQKPEYNEKIEKAVSLGPIAFMKHSNHQMLKTIMKNYKSEGWIIKNLGTSTFRPSNELKDEVRATCASHQKQERICQNHYFLYNGFNSDKYNQSTISEAYPRLPSGGSVKAVLHYAQLMESGHFQRYNTQNGETHDYNLSKVSTPVAIFYAPRDAQAHVEDVQYLVSKLPNVYQHRVINDFANNLDFIYAKNVADIYEDVINVLQQQNLDNRNFL